MDLWNLQGALCKLYFSMSTIYEVGIVLNLVPVAIFHFSVVTTEENQCSGTLLMSYLMLIWFNIIVAINCYTEKQFSLRL